MRLLVVGAGGHAKVVIDAARAARIEVAGVVDPQPGDNLLGVEIAESPARFDADAFIIAIGNNRTRAAFFSEYLETGLRPATVIHPSTVIAEGVTIGAGTFVAAGVVINVDTVIGDDAILNTSCTVDHDCIIGDHAHIGPMSGLCGGVRIGVGALLGVGCSVIPLRSVGDWAIVGAGSAVVDDVPDGDSHAGVPARSIRPVT